MKRSGSRIAIISILLLGAIIFGTVYFAWNTTFDIFQPVSANTAEANVPFNVAPGDTAAQIAQHLQDQKIIRNALAFRVWARIKGLDTRLEAGVYNLNANMTISKIIDQLLNAQPDAERVVVPEGLRIEQIVQKFAAPDVHLVKFNAQDFLKYTKHIDQFPDAANYPFLKSVPQGQSMEGFLFPATYDVPIDGTARDVVNMMLKKTSEIIKKNNLDTAGQQHHLSLYQIFILASLTEREVKFDEDRPGVAGVFWNRATNMGAETVGLLGSDPSVQYARDTENPPTKGYWTALNDTGGQIVPNSPWNTYTHPGWPLTPICSPGEKSLLAAANPPSSPYFFFLGKNDGHIVYAKTLADFNALVKQYLNK